MVRGIPKARPGEAGGGEPVPGVQVHQEGWAAEIFTKATRKPIGHNCFFLLTSLLEYNCFTMVC